MIWTTEKPTKPGWYWYRNNDCAAVVIVYEGNDGLHFEYPTHELLAVKYVAGDWSGPLVPPIDYQAQAVSDELPYSN